MTEKQPNLVLIMADQLRRDCVGAYGAKLVRTPNLDRLAEGAVIFDRYYSSCPLCAPARCSIFTGRFPHTNGVLLNASRYPDRKFARLHEDERLLTDLLASGGYQVAHVGVDHIHALPRLGERGYAKYAGRTAYVNYLAAHGLQEADLSDFRRACIEIHYGRKLIHHYSSPKPGVHPIPPEHFWDTWIARQAVEFLQGTQAGAPFALFCNFWLPHPPVVVPEPFYSMYDPADIDPPPNFMAPLSDKPQMHLGHLPGQLGGYQTREEWLNTIAVYYGMVTMVDWCIGMVLDALESRGLMRDSVVLFLPDHGEMLGCHSLYQKMVCYEESIRLPCIVRAPNAQPGRRGQLASHVDLLPTLLDYANIPCPANAHGTSLRRLIEDPATPSREAIFCEYNGNYGLGYFQRAVITERYKYIENQGDISELYDLEEDPYELRNLAQGDPSDVEIELRARLAQWQRETADFVSLCLGGYSR